MSWLDKIAKKRLAELEEHPELNEQNYSQKLNSIIFYILLLRLPYLFFCFGMTLNILKSGFSHKDKKIATIVAIIT